MNYLRRFISDSKKYREYAWEAAKAELKSEVAGSRLSWLWWVLDPMLFMMVYSFVFILVFGKKQDYLASFMFIGLSCWNFFSNVVNRSTKTIERNQGVISKVYIPKFILLYIEMEVFAFKMSISYGLVIITMCVYRVPLTWKIIFFVPLMLTLFVLAFGISLILIHFGVYIQDLANLVNVLLRLVFFMCGVFYNIEKIKKPFNTILLKYNPVALIMYDLRGCMLYGQTMHYRRIGVWFIVGIILSVIGIVTIYKNENSYAKAA